jgi:uncharacterized membrane protein YhaH (DUF805 family)
MNNPYQAPASDIRLANTGTTGPNSPFSTKGRFSRLSYIAWISIIGIAAQVFIMLAIVGLADYSNSMMTGLVTLVFQIPALICYGIFTIRRGHDLGMKGWKIGLFLLPLINFYFWFKRGDDAENAFGAPRLTTTTEQVIAFISLGLCIAGIVGIAAVVVFFGQLMPLLF